MRCEGGGVLVCVVCETEERKESEGGVSGVGWGIYEKLRRKRGKGGNLVGIDVEGTQREMKIAT